MLNLRRLRAKRKTYKQRLRSAALTWGIPMLCLAVIGIPVRAWWVVISFELPGTIVAVVIIAWIEHLIVRAIPYSEDGN